MVHAAIIIKDLGVPMVQVTKWGDFEKVTLLHGRDGLFDTEMLSLYSFLLSSIM